VSTIDIWCAYTKVPGIPTSSFPGLDPISVPLIDVILLGSKGDGISASALLDTGAAFNLFNVAYAEALGINWRTSPSFTFAGVGAPAVKGFAVDLRMALKDEKVVWPCRVVFSEADFEYPVLGHIGFFDHFEERFDTRVRGFRLLGGGT